MNTKTKNQSLTVHVITRTSGATYKVEVRDKLGHSTGRTHLFADEGGSHPHHWLAALEARDIAKRLNAEVVE